MEFYGLVGERLSHSLSPQIHKKVFKLLDIEGAYKLFEIPKDKVDNLVDALKLLKIKGVNVTIPYKEILLNQLEFLSPEAKSIGAVNTILIKDGKAHGYNTDYFGFGIMLDKHNIQVKDKIAVVLGSGGASKAVITYLLDNKVEELYLVTRDKASMPKLDSRIKVINYEDVKSITGDILINTTPVGMHPKVNHSPVGRDVINNFKAIVDIIYNPQITELLRIGEELGKIICGGLYMLVGQGIKAEEIWQDTNIDSGVTTKIYEELEKEFK
jgi:shikimate dehydrogenase